MENLTHSEAQDVRFADFIPNNSMIVERTKVCYDDRTYGAN